MVQLSHPYIPQSIRASLSLFCVHFTSQIHSSVTTSPAVHLHAVALLLPGQDASGPDMMFGWFSNSPPPYSVSWMYLFNFLRSWYLFPEVEMKNEKQHFQREKNDISYISPLIFRKWTLKSHRGTGLESSVLHLLPRRHSVRTQMIKKKNPRKLKHSKNLLGKNWYFAHKFFYNWVSLGLLHYCP